MSLNLIAAGSLGCQVVGLIPDCVHSGAVMECSSHRPGLNNTYLTPASNTFSVLSAGYAVGIAMRHPAALAAAVALIVFDALARFAIRRIEAGDYQDSNKIIRCVYQLLRWETLHIRAFAAVTVIAATVATVALRMPLSPWLAALQVVAAAVKIHYYINACRCINRCEASDAQIKAEKDKAHALITEASHRAVAQHGTASALDFSSLSLTSREIYLVTEKVANMPTVTSLKLPHFLLQEDEGYFDSLKSSRSLLRLDLGNCAISNYGYKCLDDVIPYQTTLKELDLSDNRQLDRKESFLSTWEAARMLGNPGLESLNLSGRLKPRMSGDSLSEQEFMTVLRNNQTLRVLNLSNNSLSNACAGEDGLYTALRHNTGLRSLDLSNTGITGEGLLEALEDNTTLTQLKLDGNPIPDELKDAIMRRLQRNTAPL